MKFISIILTLISFNLYANENLEGKSIVCKKIEPPLAEFQGKDIRIDGYEFLKNKKLNLYFYSTSEKKIVLANESFKRNYLYLSELSSIRIFYDVDSSIIINRETLEVTFVGESLTIVNFKEGDCKVIDSTSLNLEMKKAIKEMIAEIKKNNKI